MTSNKFPMILNSTMRRKIFDPRNALFPRVHLMLNGKHKKIQLAMLLNSLSII